MQQRKTKIVCTIGPSTNTVAMLEKMMNAGMNVARVNFSHGKHEDHLKVFNSIIQARKNVDKHVAIMLDTKGPEIRCKQFENGSIAVNKGDHINIVKEEVLGNNERFSITSEELFTDVIRDTRILIDDGKIKLKVLEHSPTLIKCEVLNCGKISNKKGINVPNIHISLPFVSANDYDDIKFGCENNIDLIAISFVRNKDDVLQIRELLKKFNRSDIEIISKIECQEAIENLKEIIEVSDGIMVARGDLGVEVKTEMVPIYQKQMIKLANAAGKPVITATHMLESMISSPIPTRAEASDVANAIYDGSDAIMLSGESAIGEYPLESVKFMDKIAKSVESSLDYRHRLEKLVKTSQRTKNDAIGISVAECCLTLDNVSAVFAFTETGGTAKRICKYRPCVPIIACSNSEQTCRKLSYYWGVSAVTAQYVDSLKMWDEESQVVAKKLNLPSKTAIILTSGFGQKHGSTNTFRIIEIE